MATGQELEPGEDPERAAQVPRRSSSGRRWRRSGCSVPPRARPTWQGSSSSSAAQSCCGWRWPTGAADDAGVDPVAINRAAVQLFKDFKNGRTAQALELKPKEISRRLERTAELLRAEEDKQEGNDDE